MINFNDGVSFNTSGNYRIDYKHDGLYVVGKGMLCPVKTMDEAIELIRALVKKDEQKK